MALDPYVELGIDRRAEATPADIRRAYRRRAAQVHPDRNPDDPFANAKMQQATEAYDILMDPERRRAFDTLGVVERPPNYDTKARDMLITCMLETLQRSGAPQLIDTMRRVLKVQLANVRQQIKVARSTNEHIAAIKAKFRCRAGENFLSIALDHKIAENAAIVAGMEQNAHITAKALEILDAFEDVQELLLASSQGGFFATGGASGSW